MKNPALAYRQFSVQGSSPLGLVVMLYDGAIAALRRAAVSITVGDIAEKCTHLTRAQAIILQLEGTLNFAAGGEVAQTLKALYVYARGQMLRANIENSPQILNLLVEKLSTVREAWNEADHRPADPSPAVGSESWAAASGPEPKRGVELVPAARAAEKYPYLPAVETERRLWDLSA